MIQELTDLPENLVGFKANGKVTKEDFQNIVIPAVKRVVKKNGYLNYLFVLESEYPEYTTGAWFQDAWLGLRHTANWNRAAIVSYSGEIVGLTDLFSHLTPGEFKGFHYNNMDLAIKWAAQPKVNHTYNFLKSLSEMLHVKEYTNKLLHLPAIIKHSGQNALVFLEKAKDKMSHFAHQEKAHLQVFFHQNMKEHINKVYRFLHLNDLDSKIAHSQLVLTGLSKKIPVFYHKMEFSIKTFLNKKDHVEEISDKKSTNSKVLSGMENS